MTAGDSTPPLSCGCTTLAQAKEHIRAMIRAHPDGAPLTAIPMDLHEQAREEMTATGEIEAYLHPTVVSAERGAPLSYVRFRA